MLQLNLQTLPQTYCKLKENKYVVTAHSQVVKSSYGGPLHCAVFGMSGKLLDPANKTRMLLQRNPVMVKKSKTWQLFFFLQVSTHAELIGRTLYARIVSNLTAKVESREFLWRRGNDFISDLKSLEEIPQIACISGTWELASEEERC